MGRNPYFSKGSVRRLQSLIDERIDVLLSRFREFRDVGKTMKISLAYMALSSGMSLISRVE